MANDIENYLSKPLKRKQKKPAPKPDRTDEILQRMVEVTEELNTKLTDMVNQMTVSITEAISQATPDAPADNSQLIADVLQESLIMITKQQQQSNLMMAKAMSELASSVKEISIEAPAVEQKPALIDLKVIRDENGDLEGVTGTRT